jgi:DNA-directed RNA polymerase subunit beta'
MIPKGKYLFVGDGDKVKKGDVLMDGTPAPHDILRTLGIEKFAKYMVEEVQKVYEMQGITINDKHIEIILKQMLRKVEVISAGETTLIVGEVLDRDEFEEVNAKAEAEGLEKAVAENVLLGITRASLQTKSFISAASFQETTKVLIDSSIIGKTDRLSGMKENVIVGKLIPAGTGLLLDRIRKEAESEIATKVEE